MEKEIVRIYTSGYRKGLISIALRYLKDEDLCCDIVSESFKIALEKPSLIKQGQIHKFLLLKVKSLCIDYLRHKDVKKKYNTNYFHLNKQFDYDIIKDLENKELLEKLFKFVETISPQQKEVFNLLCKGKTILEMQKKLNLSKKNITKRIYDMRQKLKTIKATEHFIK